jgi:ATP-dependent DNA helicase HFM1/MER3
MDNIETRLKSTFLYIRMKKNGSFYRLKNCDSEDALLTAENRLLAIFQKCLEQLVKSGIVKSNLHNEFQSTEIGQVMAKHYIKFETVKNIVLAEERNATERTMLELFCQAEEFAEVRFRNDKTILNNINKHPLIKYTTNKRVSTVHEKVFLCIQVILGDIVIPEKERWFLNECNLIVILAKRVIRGSCF